MLLFLPQEIWGRIGEFRAHRQMCALWFGKGSAGFWRNLEWNSNAQNSGHDGQGPNLWKERGGTGWVSREGVTFVILISCLPQSGFLLPSQTFLKTDRNKLFTEKCGLLKGRMAQRRNCSYLPTLRHGLLSSSVYNVLFLRFNLRNLP